MKQEPQFVIRMMTLDDVEPLRRMHARSWLETYPNQGEGVPLEWVRETTDSWLTESGLTRSREHYKGISDTPNQNYHRVATTPSGEIVGFVHGSCIDNHQRLEGIYIDKDAQGTGLAQKLIEGLMEWFDLTKDIELEVVTYNERAKAFYHKYGFEEANKENELFKGKLPNVTMIRKARQSHEA